MMSLRTRLFIIISLALLFILGISLVIIYIGKDKPTGDVQEPIDSGNNSYTPSTNNNNNTQPGTNNSGNVTPVAPKLDQEAIEKKAVESMARVFVERYGTYSSDGESGNIKDVESLSTQSLWSKLSAKIGGNISSNGAFVGMTTRVVSTELKEWQSGSAVIFIQTIRVESKDGKQTSRQQDAEVSMIKNGTTWLVDNLKWL